MVQLKENPPKWKLVQLKENRESAINIKPLITFTKFSLPFCILCPSHIITTTLFPMLSVCATNHPRPPIWLTYARRGTTSTRERNEITLSVRS